MNKNDKAIIAFGQVIKRHRERLKLSKQNLAYDSEVSVNTIKRIEKGQYGISIHVLFSIATALQVPAHVLIKETEVLINKTHEDVT